MQTELSTKKKIKTEKDGNDVDNNNKEEIEKEEIKEEEEKQVDVAAEIKKEIESQKVSNRMFYSLDTHCTGVIFIKVNPIYKDILDVKKLANAIAKDVVIEKTPVSRFCLRMVPVQYAARASLDNFAEEIAKMLPNKFKNDNPKKWMFHFKCRNNDQFKQQPFLEKILGTIGKTHSVDFKNPDYTVFLEISNHLMCISILKKFFKYNRYSLQLDIPTPNGPQGGGHKSKNLVVVKTAKPANNNNEQESKIGELEFDDEADTNEKTEADKIISEENPNKPVEPANEEEEEDVSLI
jgi:tRNA(Ser,Leu) C12 N-acetylase TAN1